MFTRSGTALIAATLGWTACNREGTLEDREAVLKPPPGPTSESQSPAAPLDVAQPRPSQFEHPSADISADARKASSSLEELAVARAGTLLCSNGVQCSGSAQWADCDPEATSESRLGAGSALYAVDAKGVHDLRVEVDGRGASVTANETALSRFALVLPRNGFATESRIHLRRLRKRVEGGQNLSAWLNKRVGEPVRAAGELRGNFGDGAHRIVVFEPRAWRSPYDLSDDEAPSTEYAVIVDATGPRAVLPFSEPSIQGLEAVGTFDLEGDGVLEVVWMFQLGGPQLVTSISLSYFTEGTFAVRKLASCSYNGCDAFFAAPDCGRSRVKHSEARKRHSKSSNSSQSDPRSAPTEVIGCLGKTIEECLPPEQVRKRREQDSAVASDAARFFSCLAECQDQLEGKKKNRRQIDESCSSRCLP